MTLNRSVFDHVLAATVTPFTREGDLDLDALRSYLQRLKTFSGFDDGVELSTPFDDRFE